MDILEKAKELGVMLSECDEFKRVTKAQIAQDMDEEAKSIIHNYNTKREEIMQKAQAKDITQDEFMALREEMQAEYEKLSNNPIIKELMEAMDEFNKLLEQVNKLTTMYVVPDNGGCTGSCSSCSGCH